MANRCVVLLLCCAIALTAAGCAVLDPEGTRQRNTERMIANQEVAVDIINALAEYKQSVGSFPESLEALVPGYLSATPETVHGEPFTYHRDHLSGYYLCFYLPGYRDGGCCFHQRVCLWECATQPIGE